MILDWAEVQTIISERTRLAEQVAQIAEMWASVRLVDEQTGSFRKDWPGLAEALDGLIRPGSDARRGVGGST